MEVYVKDFTYVNVTMQIQHVSSNEQLRELLLTDKFDFVLECGFLKPTTTLVMEDIPSIMKAVFLEHVIVRCTQELVQFKEGLASLGILALIERHPVPMKKLLVHDPDGKLTADHLTRLIRPVLSPRGNNQRELEEAIVLNWNDYLQDAEGTLIEI